MSENRLRTGLLTDRRQLAFPHARLSKKVLEELALGEMKGGGMTRSRSGAVETHPPKSPPKRAL